MPDSLIHSAEMYRYQRYERNVTYNDAATSNGQTKFDSSKKPKSYFRRSYQSLTM